MSTVAIDDGARTTTAERFVAAMSTVCTPVAVVTAMAGARPHGTTVSAFASLSLAPPMVVVALDRASALLPLVLETRRFGVNLLTSEQAGLADAFARKGAAKFDGVAWHLVAGMPRLSGPGGWLACDLHDTVDGGDHVVLLGAVADAVPSVSAPLTYSGRRFGTHLALP
ncbi:MAG TPA: flavin reductase family protein [Mycobacteriales bacterium]|jgi:flavin reductase (DIM6/NTAB) family NADH-FMN oxidoreductase RutF|nr:flavin reductase family protein [Mycobacteriales bacterium]